MSGKTISLSGEVRISAGSVSTTVDALEALKSIGMAYGLYSRSEDSRDERVMLEDGDHPALVVQEDISYHGSPAWRTVCTITDDPEQINRYLAFREVVKIVRQIEIEQSRQPVPASQKQTVRKGPKPYER